MLFNYLLGQLDKLRLVELSGGSYQHEYNSCMSRDLGSASQYRQTLALYNKALEPIQLLAGIIYMQHVSINQIHFWSSVLGRHRSSSPESNNVCR